MLDDEDNLDYYGDPTDDGDSSGLDDAYVDPQAMADYGRPGPTKAAAAANDIDYQSAPFKEYDARQQAAVQGLRDARARAVEALRPTDDKSRYLALAAGFLSPTRTGGFGESIGNALQNYLPYQQQRRQEELGYKSALSKYDTDIAQAEYTQALKPPVFTDVYDSTTGGKQKVMVINGRPYPIGGVGAPPGGGHAFLDKMNWLEHASPAQRALFDKYGRTAPISITMAEKNANDKKLGQWDAEQYGKLQSEALGAPVKIANWQRLGSLLGQVRTGKFRGAINEFAKGMQTVGFDPAAIGIDAHTGIADAANAAQRAMALELRNPSGGAGMPGAMSDSDREFLNSMTPSLETSPDAIPLMVNWQVKLAQRSQQVFKLAREYNKKHGIVDDGFYDELQTWSDAHPLFDDADRKAIEQMGGGGTAAAPTGSNIQHGSTVPQLPADFDQ